MVDPMLRSAKKCSAAECDRPASSRTWCTTHLERWRTHGDIFEDIPVRTKHKTIEDRFWAKVVMGPNECWVWSGALSGRYHRPHFVDQGKHLLAYRWSYEHLVEPIPDGMELDHTCVNPRCVNPSHLDVVTSVENMRRAVVRRAQVRLEKKESMERSSAK